MPDDFNVNTIHPIDYFKLFFTNELIQHIVKCTNDYACIAINKKRRTKPNYVDQLWSLDGSDDITCEELCAYLGCCVILSVNLSRQLSLSHIPWEYSNFSHYIDSPKSVVFCAFH